MGDRPINGGKRRHLDLDLVFKSKCNCMRVGRRGWTDLPIQIGSNYYFLILN